MCVSPYPCILIVNWYRPSYGTVYSLDDVSKCPPVLSNVWSKLIGGVFVDPDMMAINAASATE